MESIVECRDPKTGKRKTVRGPRRLVERAVERLVEAGWVREEEAKKASLAPAPKPPAPAGKPEAKPPRPERPSGGDAKSDGD